MNFLLDVNILIGLVDPTHMNHDPVHDWFAAEGRHGFATCPITENGLLRIVGHPKYPNTPGSPATVAGVLVQLRVHPGHVFWPDDISLLDTARVDASKILTHKQVTDTYLLALALAHGGKLATLDRRLAANAVRGGRGGLRLI